jgi:hypothetical protein
VLLNGSVPEVGQTKGPKISSSKFNEVPKAIVYWKDVWAIRGYVTCFISLRKGWATSLSDIFNVAQLGKLKVEDVPTTAPAVASSSSAAPAASSSSACPAAAFAVVGGETPVEGAAGSEPGGGTDVGAGTVAGSADVAGKVDNKSAAWQKAKNMVSSLIKKVPV